MALQVGSLQGLLTSQLTANQIVGERAPDLARAVATGVITFMFTGQVTASVTGTLGGGTATGFGIPGYQGSTVEGLLVAQFSSQGITGQYMPNLAKAIGQSVGTIISSSAQTQIPIAGVGIGSGTGTLVGFTPSTLTGLLQAQFASVGFTGQYVNAMATAIATGVASPLNGQQMVLTVAGSPSPVPSAGSGTSVLF